MYELLGGVKYLRFFVIGEDKDNMCRSL